MLPTSSQPSGAHQKLHRCHHSLLPDCRKPVHRSKNVINENFSILVCCTFYINAKKHSSNKKRKKEHYNCNNTVGTLDSLSPLASEHCSLCYNKVWSQLVYLFESSLLVYTREQPRHLVLHMLYTRECCLGGASFSRRASLLLHRFRCSRRYEQRKMSRNPRMLDRDCQPCLESLNGLVPINGLVRLPVVP